MITSLTASAGGRSKREEERRPDPRCGTADAFLTGVECSALVAAVRLQYRIDMKSATVAVQLPRRSCQELERLARRWGRAPADLAGTLVEESLRTCVFANLEFRATPAGRVPYLAGTRLAIHQVASILKDFKGSIENTARHLHIAPDLVRTARRYARDYGKEIDRFIENNERGFETLQGSLPKLEKA
jgi:hypothetical protein